MTLYQKFFLAIIAQILYPSHQVVIMVLYVCIYVGDQPGPGGGLCYTAASCTGQTGLAALHPARGPHLFCEPYHGTGEKPR